MRSPYWPASDSPMASPNQLYSTISIATMPAEHTPGPQAVPLTQPDAPAIVTSIEMPAAIGQREGPGMK